MAKGFIDPTIYEKEVAMARGRSVSDGPSNYPEGDHPTGVVFYRIDSRRLPWEACKEVVIHIAQEFASQGPFVVRIGRREDGKHYWLGFNAVECGEAFERDVDTVALKIKRADSLPGSGRLRQVLSEQKLAELGPQPEPEWGGVSPDAPPTPNYADEYHGVVYYRLVRDEIDPTLAVDAVRDIAELMLHPVGHALPFALRCGTVPAGNCYWVALNSAAAGLMFERFLLAAQVRAKKQSVRPDEVPDRPLRSVLQLEGVPPLPLAQSTPMGPPPRRPRVTEPIPEAEPARRDRMAWARSIDLSKVRGRFRIPRRSRQDPPE